MTTAKLAMVTLDCADPGPVSASGPRLALDLASGDETYAMLKGPDGPAIGFGKVADHEAPPWPDPHGSKQFHFDLAVEDIPAAEERCLELGATLADPQPGETWRVLLDPAGHAFCLTSAANWGLSCPVRRCAIAVAGRTCASLGVAGVRRRAPEPSGGPDRSLASRANPSGRGRPVGWSSRSR